MWGREKGGVCSEATKCTAEKETSVLPMKKGTGAQWYVRYVSEKHSIGGERMENQKKDSNVYGV